ncbi:MAG: hypothetical protein QM750_20400 [Rubrivivax sp.]
MSPSWRETLAVELGAQGLRLRRLARGWRLRVLDEQQQPLAARTPAAAAQALAAALQAAAPARGAAARVLLSGDWVRLALLDDAGALRGAAERQAAAVHALRRVYGDAAGAWQAAACAAGAGSLLAAGVDADLPRQLAAALQAHDASLASLQPALVPAVNRCRRWLRRPGWLVSVEPGLATLAYGDGRRLRSLRCHRLRRELALELPQWLDQARLVDGLAKADAPLTLAHRGVTLPALPGLQPAPRLVALDD